MARRKGRPPCSVDGCEKPAAGRGLCSMHWQRWRKHGDPLYERPSLEDRFWSRVQKTDSCWLWTGALFQGSGYGMFSVERRPALAHRVAYELLVGPIPDDMQLDHLCRVRQCINPAHLEAVTGRVNLLRGRTYAASNAAKTHCPKGHAYDDENTRIKPNGARACRACERQHNKDWYSRTHTRVGRISDRNREKTHCPQGHPYSEDNTYTSGGRRRCKTCVLERNRAAAPRRRRK